MTREDLRSTPLGFDPHARGIAAMAAVENILHPQELPLGSVRAADFETTSIVANTISAAQVAAPVRDPHGYQRIFIAGLSTSTALLAIAVAILVGKIAGFW